jgi:hypothetical protein
VPTTDDPAHALSLALHSMQGAAGPSGRRRKSGLDDAALLDAIRHELGGQGGLTGPGLRVAWRGGPGPAIWLGVVLPEGRPALSGRRLLAAARRVLDVGLPKSEGPGLFDRMGGS